MLPYEVFALGDIDPEQFPVTRGLIDQSLANFACERSEHLQRFARETVTRFEKHGHSRTYVLSTPTEDAGLDVAGFFTIGMTSLDLSQASKSTRAKLMGDVTMDVTGAYCIAELARSDKYDSAQLPGSIILDEAKQVIRRARALVAGRFLVVDAQEVVFTQLYEPNGFRRIAVAQPPRGMEDRDFVTACAVIRDW